MRSHTSPDVSQPRPAETPAVHDSPRAQAADITPQPKAHDSGSPATPVKDVELPEAAPRETVPDIPDSGRYRDYPNPQAVDPLSRNDLIVPPDSKPYGVGPDGTDNTPERYAEQHLKVDPEAKRPISIDANGEKLVADWDDNLDRGFHPDFPITERPISELTPGTLFARIGYPGGYNFTDPGTPFKELSMPPHSLAQKCMYMSSSTPLISPKTLELLKESSGQIMVNLVEEISISLKASEEI